MHRSAVRGVANGFRGLVNTLRINIHPRVLARYHLKAHQALCRLASLVLLIRFLSTSLTKCTCSSSKVSMIVSKRNRGATTQYSHNRSNHWLVSLLDGKYVRSEIGGVYWKRVFRQTADRIARSGGKPFTKGVR